MDIVVQKNDIWSEMIRQAFKFLSVINNDYYFVRFPFGAGGVCDDKYIWTFMCASSFNS